MDIDATIKLRRDTYANWVAVNPILLIGEVAVDTTNRNIKIGDGTSTWLQLEYYINDGLQDDLEFVLDIINGEDVTNPLTYLNETKNLIKAAINNKEVEVLDTDSFRSYATKIDSIETGAIDPSVEQRIEGVNGENSGDVYADLTLLETNKSNIKSAIEEKGVTVGTAKLSDYDTLISSIQAGSSVEYGFNNIYEVALSSLGITSSNTVYKFVSLSGNVYISANITSFGLYKLDKTTKTFTKVYTGNYITTFFDVKPGMIYAMLSSGGLLKIVENGDNSVTITNPITTNLSTINIFDIGESYHCILVPVSGSIIRDNGDNTFTTITGVANTYNIWREDDLGRVYGWGSVPNMYFYYKNTREFIQCLTSGQSNFNMYKCATQTYFANGSGAIACPGSDNIITSAAVNSGYSQYFPTTSTSQSYVYNITSGTKLYAGGMGQYGIVVADGGVPMLHNSGIFANAFIGSSNYLGEQVEGISNVSYFRYNSYILRFGGNGSNIINTGTTSVTGGYIANNQVVFYYLNSSTNVSQFYYLDGDTVITANTVSVYNGLSMKKTMSDGTDIFYSSSGTTMYIWSSNQMVSLGVSAMTINVTTVNGSDYLLGGMGYLYKWNTTTKTFDLQKDTSNNSLYISGIVANGSDLYGVASSMTPGVYRLLSGETTWTKLNYSGSMLYVSGTLTIVVSGGKIFLVGVVADSTDVSSQAITKTFKIDGTTVTNVSGLCGKLLKTNRYIYYGLIGSAEYIYSLNGTYSGTGYPTRNNGYFVYVANNNTHILCG